jgi:hypothetical protein
MEFGCQWRSRSSFMIQANQKLLFILNDPPYGTGRALNALLLATTLLNARVMR